MYNVRADPFYCSLNLLSGEVLVVHRLNALLCQSSCALNSNISSSFQVKGKMFSSVPRSLSVL